jgi:hypothetical protein
MDRCIFNLFSSTTNKLQRYTMYLFLWNSLHVSGGSSAHHQELKTVYTASGTCQAWLLPVTVVEELQLVCIRRSVTNLPPHRQVAVNPGKYPLLCIQVWAPDDGRRTRLKHVEHSTEINTLCNVASCWLYLKINHIFSVGEEASLSNSSIHHDYLLRPKFLWL